MGEPMLLVDEPDTTAAMLVLIATDRNDNRSAEIIQRVHAGRSTTVDGAELTGPATVQPTSSSSLDEPGAAK